LSHPNATNKSNQSTEPSQPHFCLQVTNFQVKLFSKQATKDVYVNMSTTMHHSESQHQTSSLHSNKLAQHCNNIIYLWAREYNTGWWLGWNNGHNAKLKGFLLSTITTFCHYMQLILKLSSSLNHCLSIPYAHTQLLLWIRQILQ